MNRQLNFLSVIFFLGIVVPATILIAGCGSATPIPVTPTVAPTRMPPIASPTSSVRATVPPEWQCKMPIWICYGNRPEIKNSIITSIKTKYPDQDAPFDRWTLTCGTYKLEISKCRVADDWYVITNTVSGFVWQGCGYYISDFSGGGCRGKFQEIIELIATPTPTPNR